MILNKAKLELMIHNKMVDTFWKQKTNLKWKLERVEITKFFLKVRERRKLLHIHRINVNVSGLKGMIT